MADYCKQMQLTIRTTNSGFLRSAHVTPLGVGARALPNWAALPNLCQGVHCRTAVYGLRTRTHEHWTFGFALVTREEVVLQ